MIEPTHHFHFEPFTEGKAPACYESTLTIALDLPYFEGHFPNQPVLPAIAIIDGSLEAISLVLKRRVTLSKIERGKFTAVIAPGSRIQITLSQLGESEWKAEWKLVNPNGSPKPAAELRLRF